MEQIEKWCSARVIESFLKERKTTRKCDYEKAKYLYIWFTNHRGRGFFISGSILQENALQFRIKFDEGDQLQPVRLQW